MAITTAAMIHVVYLKLFKKGILPIPTAKAMMVTTAAGCHTISFCTSKPATTVAAARHAMSKRNWAKFFMKPIEEFLPGVRSQLQDSKESELFCHQEQVCQLLLPSMPVPIQLHQPAMTILSMRQQPLHHA
jgi:hypothetical protein